MASLELALPFLRASHDTIDPSLPYFLSVLRSTGACECWHKHGTFFEHLFEVYRMLCLWRAPAAVSRCGLFHSAYSNSYVNLAIFQPNVDRQKVRDIIGDEAEQLVHLFCVVPRHQLIHDMLLFRFTDRELLSALNERMQETKLENGHVGSTESSASSKMISKDFYQLHGLQKLRRIIPREGITVKHIHTGADVHLPRSVIAIFLLLTMADFADQLTGWQDALFGNEDGTLRWEKDSWETLWPGDGKPGLWMNSISRMGVLVNLLIQEEKQTPGYEKGKNEKLQIEVPPVFNNCTAILEAADQIKALDLYWQAVHMKAGKKTPELTEPLLLEAVNLNPFVGEPHVLLAQVYLSLGKFDVAKIEAKKGLNLLLDWGTNWDKRISWEGWISWARVLEMNAKEKTWPKTAWGVVNLGLVK